MLAAIPRALRLSPDERDYLYRVAGQNPPDRTSATDYVATSMLRVLDRLHGTPALVLSPLGGTLFQNGPARALVGDKTGYQGARNAARSIAGSSRRTPTD